VSPSAGGGPPSGPERFEGRTAASQVPRRRSPQRRPPRPGTPNPAGAFLCSGSGLGGLVVSRFSGFRGRLSPNGPPSHRLAPGGFSGKGDWLRAKRGACTLYQPADARIPGSRRAWVVVIAVWEGWWWTVARASGDREGPTARRPGLSATECRVVVIAVWEGWWWTVARASGDREGPTAQRAAVPPGSRRGAFIERNRRVVERGPGFAA